MHRHGAVALLLGGLALTPQTEHVRVHFSGEEPRRCVVPPDTPPRQAEVARACAELFVLLGGFTGRIATKDTTLLSREPYEVGSWDVLIRRRRYIADPKAFDADCEFRGCVVFFRPFRVGTRCLAVHMTDDYADLHFGIPDRSELLRGGSARQRCTS